MWSSRYLRGGLTQSPSSSCIPRNSCLLGFSSSGRDLSFRLPLKSGLDKAAANTFLRRSRLAPAPLRFRAIAFPHNDNLGTFLHQIPSTTRNFSLTSPLVLRILDIHQNSGVRNDKQHQIS